MSSDQHDATPDAPGPDEVTEVRAAASDPFSPPVADGAPSLEKSATVEPSPVVVPAAATAEHPAGTAVPESDWMKPDAGAAAATPAPDPIIATPSAFTPPGTPDGGSATPAVTDRPEVQVGLAFLGGAVASFVLKRFGRR